MWSQANKIVFVQGKHYIHDQLSSVVKYMQQYGGQLLFLKLAQAQMHYKEL